MQGDFIKVSTSQPIKPTLNTQYALDTVKNDINNTPTVSFEDENHGYNKNLDEIKNLFDEETYKYLDGIYGFSSPDCNIGAFRLEDFQDGSYYLEFDTDGDFENRKANNMIGMDFSYESAVVFTTNEADKNNVISMAIFDEDDINNQQNCKNYTKDVTVFEEDEPFTFQEEVNLESSKDFFSTNGINRFSESILSKFLNSDNLSEFNYIKDEQAKMITHVVNPIKDEDPSCYQNDITQAQNTLEQIAFGDGFKGQINKIIANIMNVFLASKL